MEHVSRILSHYRHEKHFLQSVNLGHAEVPFLYMKNHKSACTTVLATLIAMLNRRSGVEINQSISNEEIHKPHKSRLLTGPRELTVQDALEAMADRSFFRFTVVRDPLRRVLSAYADKMRDGMKPRIWLMKYLKRPLDSDMSLSAFLDLIANDSGAMNVDRHWRRQCDEIAYDFISYNYIGQVEELERAMKHIAWSVFGYKNVGIVDTRRTLQHNTHSASLAAQLSNQDRKNIQKAYGPDFDMYSDVTKTFGEIGS